MKFESTAVEEWAKEFERSKKRPLSDDEVVMVIKATLSEKNIDTNKEVLELLENKNGKPSMATIVYQRVKGNHSFILTPTAALLSEIVANNFGSSTMLCAYMQYKAHQLNIQRIDVEVFSRNIISDGIPTEEELQRLWDLQKLDSESRKKIGEFGSDNGLDYKVTYESIMEIN